MRTDSKRSALDAVLSTVLRRGWLSGFLASCQGAALSMYSSHRPMSSHMAWRFSRKASAVNP